MEQNNLKTKGILLMNTKPTKNGRSYSLEVLESIASQINERGKSRNIGVMGVDNFLSNSGSVSIDQAAFVYDNARIENESLYIDVDFIPTPMSEKLRGLLLKEAEGGIKLFSFRPAGNGNIEDGVVTNYDLTTVTVIPSSDDAINTD